LSDRSPDPQPPTIDYGNPGTPDLLGSASTTALLGPFADLLDANLSLNALQNAGIAAELVGEHQAAMLGPIYGAAYGGPKIMVRKVDEPEARKVIADIERLRRERRERDQPPCPRCQSRHLSRLIPPMRWFGIVLIVSAIFAIPPLGPYGPIAAPLVGVFGLYLLVCKGLPYWRCKDCGTKFSAPLPLPVDVVYYEEGDAEGRGPGREEIDREPRRVEHRKSEHS
jgi:hypothetical protein